MCTYEPAEPNLGKNEELQRGDVCETDLHVSFLPHVFGAAIVSDAFLRSFKHQGLVRKEMRRATECAPRAPPTEAVARLSVARVSVARVARAEPAGVAFHLSGTQAPGETAIVQALRNTHSSR